MGLHAVSPWSLLLILAIVVIIFGTKRLRNVGGDLGKAYKEFKTAMNEKKSKKKESE